MRSTGGDYPRPKLSDRSQPPPKQMLADRDAIAQAVEESGIDAHRLPAVLKSAQAWIERLRTKQRSRSGARRPD